MCGIVGAIARRDVVPSLLEGLKRLEYRGYDSAGVAVLNGLVVMSAIRQRLEDGVELTTAIIDALMEKVRPVVMTGLVPAIGFIPMALAHGTGAEVQKPLAMVVIGGLITATLLTLLVLPAITRLLLGRTARKRQPQPALAPAE